MIAKKSYVSLNDLFRAGIDGGTDLPPVVTRILDDHDLDRQMP